MVNEDGAELLPAPVPDGVGRELVACVHCGLCKTVRQYEMSGCENCDPSPMQATEIAENTTPNFSGLLAIMEPGSSWCAKWTRKKKYCPGVYALRVGGGS